MNSACDSPCACVRCSSSQNSLSRTPREHHARRCCCRDVIAWLASDDRCRHSRSGDRPRRWGRPRHARRRPRPRPGARRLRRPPAAEAPGLWLFCRGPGPERYGGENRERETGKREKGGREKESSVSMMLAIEFIPRRRFFSTLTSKKKLQQARSSPLSPGSTSPIQRKKAGAGDKSSSGTQTGRAPSTRRRPPRRRRRRGSRPRRPRTSGGGSSGFLPLRARALPARGGSL